MKHLIIVSHPSSEGFAHKIVKTFFEVSKEKGDVVEIIDLYDERFSQDFLKFENIKDFSITDVTKRIHKTISSADNLVFVAPMWWQLPTARMVNFFDCNFVSGFAYKFSESGEQKLLIGKTAQIFMTADSSNWYFCIFKNLSKVYFKRNLSFCGVKLKSFVLFGNMRKADGTKRIRFLEKVKRLV